MLFEQLQRFLQIAGAVQNSISKRTISCWAELHFRRLVAELTSLPESLEEIRDETNGVDTMFSLTPLPFSVSSSLLLLGASLVPIETEEVLLGV